MTTHRQTTLHAQIVDDGYELSLRQICREQGVTSSIVISLVREGVLKARGRTPRDWRFAPAASRRLRTAMRLRDTLDLNVPGVALALQLLDEIEVLRTRVNTLESLLDPARSERRR